MVRIVAYSTPVRSVLGPKCAIRTPKHAPQTWATLGLRYAQRRIRTHDPQTPKQTLDHSDFCESPQQILVIIVICMYK